MTCASLRSEPSLDNFHFHRVSDDSGHVASSEFVLRKCLPLRGRKMGLRPRNVLQRGQSGDVGKPRIADRAIPEMQTAKFLHTPQMSETLFAHISRPDVQD